MSTINEIYSNPQASNLLSKLSDYVKDVTSGRSDVSSSRSDASPDIMSGYRNIGLSGMMEDYDRYNRNSKANLARQSANAGGVNKPRANSPLKGQTMSLGLKAKSKIGTPAVAASRTGGRKSITRPPKERTSVKPKPGAVNRKPAPGMSIHRQSAPVLGAQVAQKMLGKPANRVLPPGRKNMMPPGGKHTLPRPTRASLKPLPTAKTKPKQHEGGEFIQDYTNGQPKKKRTILEKTKQIIENLQRTREKDLKHNIKKVRRKRSAQSLRSESPRYKRHLGPHDSGGIQRLISTGKVLLLSE